VNYFEQSKASIIEVAAQRGSSKLSNGTVMAEEAGVAAERANKVRDILVGLGIPAASVRVQVITGYQPDGVNDAWSRKVTLSVKP
jgi:hypothetical protein